MVVNACRLPKYSHVIEVQLAEIYIKVLTQDGVEFHVRVTTELLVGVTTELLEGVETEPLVDVTTEPLMGMGSKFTVDMSQL